MNVVDGAPLNVWLKLHSRGFGFVLSLLIFSMCQGTSVSLMLAGGRVELREDVEVRGDVIHLSDLLPGDAPAGLRNECSVIAIGAAPQPGRLRVLQRAEIEHQLTRNPDLLARVEIPNEAVIGRFHRSLTSSELLRAIRAGLAGLGSVHGGSLNLNELRLSAPPVYVTVDAPGLRLQRIVFDPLREETRFQIWTSNEPGILPFWVSIPGRLKLPAVVAQHDLSLGQVVSQSDFEVVPSADWVTPGGRGVNVEALDGRKARAPIKQGQAVNRSMFAPVTLVEPGKPAKLIKEIGAIRVSTVVIPIEPGVLGQEIRVRNVDTQQILRAEVIGQGRLRPVF